jgi:hypothetical protein
VSHAFLCDARFWRFLLELDQDLATEIRDGGCPHCAAVLHSARYPRKPRGISRSVLGDGYEWRLSFCCAREGCRRRCTPPSVRFFNRRVYLGALVVLISALTHGLTTRRRKAFREHFGISERTLGRWRRWWREGFPATRWWRATQARFIPPLDRGTLPASLLERFPGADPASQLLAVLRFLTPLSTACERIR